MKRHPSIRYTALPMAMLALAALVAASRSLAADRPTATAKPTIARICSNCHQPKAGQLFGQFDSVSAKASSIQMTIDDSTEILQYDEDTVRLTGADARTVPAEGVTEALRAIKKGHEVRISFAEKDGIKTASQIVVKPPVSVKPDQLIKTEEVARLVALGPEQGRYTLVDSRPATRFQEGAIPTAINVPYPSFDKMTNLLPTDKNRLIIFYCSGPTCSMSPNSASKAEKLGYTSIKVYQGGMPDWSRYSYSVIQPRSLKEAWLDKDAPAVILDVRPTDTARQGFIRGAVSFPADTVKSLLATLPSPDKKAPIIVYDTTGQGDAATVAKALVVAGQTNVKLLAGGLNAWKAAGLPLESGSLKSTVSYVPKPREGEISVEEFKKLIVPSPDAIVLLDVRNLNEGDAGMLPGARLISVEDLLQRPADLPRGREIVTYCNTGVRAEMAYHILKEKGYAVRYFNGKVEFDKAGLYKITKD